MPAAVRRRPISRPGGGTGPASQPPRTARRRPARRPGPERVSWWLAVSIPRRSAPRRRPPPSSRPLPRRHGSARSCHPDHPGQGRTRQVGLGDETLSRTAVQAGPVVGGAAARGEHDDFPAAGVCQALGHGETVEVGELNVEQDQAGRRDLTAVNAASPSAASPTTANRRPRAFCGPWPGSRHGRRRSRP